MIQAVVLIAFSLLGHCTLAAYDGCLWHPRPLTRKFCLNPPAVNVDFDRYLGNWYQVYASSQVLMAPNSNCVSANYSSFANGSILVRNCFFSGGPSATCVDGRATKTEKPGNLAVRFGQSPPNPYIVAGLLGEAEWGYYAAAVYSCSVREGEFRELWFLIARSPYLPRRTFNRLARKLRCNGYDLSRTEFVPTKQGRGCEYFFGSQGFTSIAPSCFSAPNRSELSPAFRGCQLE